MSRTALSASAFRLCAGVLHVGLHCPKPEETAACLEVSAEVVKTRLHRARAMLRDALYRRAGAGLHSIFTFGAQRCDRVVAKMMEEIRGCEGRPGC